MRVLIVHSRYRSGVSGENRVVDDEARLLLDGGHDVHVWDPTPSVGPLALARTAAGAVWSRSASTEIRRLVRDRRADVVHCHNLFPVLSPAALRAAASEGAAVVVTLHNYRMLCLPADFRRAGQPCEDCLGRVPWRGVVRRCYRGSVFGSGALATSLTLHRTLDTFDAPRKFLAVSQFVRQKHIDAGWAPERITVKPNFSWPAPRRDGLGDYFVFLGRLSPEKGIAELVAAWGRIPAKLVVVGTGPQESEMRSVASPQVEFRGLVAATEVPSILAGARALMVPSMCYEGQPRSVLEAYAAGVPVVAHRIGGLPEVVIEGETGMLVDPADERGWSDAVLRLLDDREARRLGDGAYRCWNNHYSPKRALQLLEIAYREALTKG
jgi:glycosyltransferase involved in cell wall biosynthesis